MRIKSQSLGVTTFLRMGKSLTADNDGNLSNDKALRVTLRKYTNLLCALTIEDGPPLVFRRPNYLDLTLVDDCRDYTYSYLR